MTAPTAVNPANTRIFTQTMLAPPGVPNSYEITMPAMNVTTEMTAEHTVTALKLLNPLMLHSAGNIIRLEISIEPIMRIPTTIVIAVSSAISMLYRPAFVPVARAKLSSKVIAKILV